MALVEGMADHGFDYSLAANVEFFLGGFEFFEHGGGEADVDALDGPHHLARVGGKAREVFALVGQAGDAAAERDFFLDCVFFQEFPFCLSRVP